MNIDVAVAHEGDFDGADEAFVYTDLDGELDTVALIGEVYKDVATDYAGYLTEIREVEGVGTKVLVRLTRMGRTGIIPTSEAVLV